MEWFETFGTWFMSLGEQYGVNPLLFGAIYVGAIPFFTLSVGWVVRNQRRGQSIVLPVLSALFFFVSAYIYLIVAGENVPIWVYGIIIIMIIYGGYSTIRKIRRAVHEEDSA
jgi:ABC-type Co2+ transport system permease subunit